MLASCNIHTFFKIFIIYLRTVNNYLLFNSNLACPIQRPI